MPQYNWTNKKVQEYGFICALLGIAVGILGTIFVQKLMETANI